MHMRKKIISEVIILLAEIEKQKIEGKKKIEKQKPAPQD